MGQGSCSRAVLTAENAVKVLLLRSSLPPGQVINPALLRHHRFCRLAETCTSSLTLGPRCWTTNFPTSSNKTAVSQHTSRSRRHILASFGKPNRPRGGRTGHVFRRLVCGRAKSIEAWSFGVLLKSATDFSAAAPPPTKPTRPRLPHGRRLPQPQRLFSATGPSWRTAGRKAGSRNDDAAQ